MNIERGGEAKLRNDKHFESAEDFNPFSRSRELTFLADSSCNALLASSSVFFSFVSFRTFSSSFLYLKLAKEFHLCFYFIIFKLENRGHSAGKQLRNCRSRFDESVYIYILFVSFELLMSAGEVRLVPCRTVVTVS